MMDKNTPHLVTFLGTGRYQQTNYLLEDNPDRVVKARFVARAIAELFDAGRVTVLATKLAEEQHGEDLRGTLVGREVTIVQIPEGRTESELWKQCAALDEAVRASRGPLLLDITHGFRSQPFFAAGVLALQRAAGALEDREVRVLYGRFLPTEPDRSPIWDLSVMLELLDWAQGASLFVHGGSAGYLANKLRDADKQLRARERGPLPHTFKLAQALQAFAHDYATLRVQGLLTKRAKHLAESLDEYKEKAKVYLPMLAPVLEKMEAMVTPLRAPQLYGEEGQQALLELARRYRHQERYVEALAVTREAFVSLYARSSKGAEPGDGYDEEARRMAERAWQRAYGEGSPLALDLRNDVLHCGYRKRPRGGDVVVAQVDKVIDGLQEAMQKGAERKGHLGSDLFEAQWSGRTWVVSRHAGAVAWLREQGVCPDEEVEHLNLASIREGDTVVGSLPVHLVAEICKRGARYLHLQIEVPRDLRGHELSAEQMRRFGARLVPVSARVEEKVAG